MKHLRKQPACLNCHRPLRESDNYCPSCGQENTSIKFGLNALVHDFFSNYFSFDSKLSRSGLPFLIKPGCLTLRFNEGKRVGYVHPLRLYLIITFIFFFFLALLIDTLVAENKLSLKPENGLLPKAETMPPAANKKLQLTLDSIQTKLNAKDSALVDLPDTTAFLRLDQQESKFYEIFTNPELSDQQVLDSLNIESSFPNLFVHQTRKIMQKDLDVFLPYLIKNLSIMMFLLLPVFAFFLYLLFRKRERYYISHIIHALHLHSFSFFILTLLVVVEFFTNTDTLYIITFIIISIYAFLSVKKVYGQGWGKTLLKFSLLGFLYFTTLLMSVVVEVLVSVALF